MPGSTTLGTIGLARPAVRVPSFAPAPLLTISQDAAPFGYCKTVQLVACAIVVANVLVNVVYLFQI